MLVGRGTQGSAQERPPRLEPVPSHQMPSSAHSVGKGRWEPDLDPALSGGRLCRAAIQALKRILFLPPPTWLCSRALAAPFLSGCFHSDPAVV